MFLHLNIFSGIIIPSIYHLKKLIYIFENVSEQFNLELIRVYISTMKTMLDCYSELCYMVGCVTIIWFIIESGILATRILTITILEGEVIPAPLVQTLVLNSWRLHMLFTLLFYFLSEKTEAGFSRPTYGCQVTIQVRTLQILWVSSYNPGKNSADLYTYSMLMVNILL